CRRAGLPQTRRSLQPSAARGRSAPRFRQCRTPLRAEIPAPVPRACKSALLAISMSRHRHSPPRDRHDMPEPDRPGKWLGEQETAGLQCHHQYEARHQAPEAGDQRCQKHELKTAAFKPTAEDGVAYDQNAKAATPGPVVSWLNLGKRLVKTR